MSSHFLKLGWFKKYTEHIKIVIKIAVDVISIKLYLTLETTLLPYLTQY